MITIRGVFVGVLLAAAGIVGCGGDVTFYGSGGGTCDYNGTSYRYGDSFPAGDGCNSCNCSEDGVGCTTIGCVQWDCEWEGNYYAKGESFPAGDGCNECSCGAEGQVACTNEDCADGCVYAGNTYELGDSFPALDGCNTCTCDRDNQTSCTELPCMCNPEAEWYRKYISESLETCAVIDFGCPPNTIGFENQCGCGCEQNAACPEWFNCMPPQQCNVEQLKGQCPYSGFAF